MKWSLLLGIFGCASSTYAQGGAGTTTSDVKVWHNDTYFRTWIKYILASTKLSDLSISGIHETMIAGVMGDSDMFKTNRLVYQISQIMASEL